MGVTLKTIEQIRGALDTVRGDFSESEFGKGALEVVREAIDELERLRAAQAACACRRTSLVAPFATYDAGSNK